MYVNYFMQALQNIKVLNSFLDTRSLLHFSNNLKTTIWTNQAEIASTLVVCVSILFADVIFISHFCLITPVGPTQSISIHFYPFSSTIVHFHPFYPFLFDKPSWLGEGERGRQCSDVEPQLDPRNLFLCGS